MEDAFEFAKCRLLNALDGIAAKLSDSNNISFNEWQMLAGDIIRRRRRDRPIHPSCIARWTRHGLHGVQLEALKIGRTWCTSRESLVRFFQRLTQAAQPGPPPDGSMAPTNRQHVRAEKALEQAGI
jgi:hypothetical protein